MVVSLVQILIAIVIFALIIIIHEFGHFITAKLSGVKVNEFSMGMGPQIFSIAKGETKYSLRLFPIGGYVSMEGEDAESNDERAFCNIKSWKKIIIVTAGAAMNILLGFIILAYLTTQKDLVPTTIIHSFKPNSVTSAQLKPLDEILEINNYKIKINTDVVFAFIRDNDGVFDILVKRDGKKILLNDVKFRTSQGSDGKNMIDIDFIFVGKPKTFFNVAKLTYNWTLSIVKQVIYSVFDLITGTIPVAELSGPVGTTTAIGEATSMGLNSLLLLIAFITINVGVFNLLPLPALDGGRLVFIIIQAVTGKPLLPKYEGYIHATGLMLLFGLMIYVTFNDVVKLFQR